MVDTFLPVFRGLLDLGMTMIGAEVPEQVLLRRNYAKWVLVGSSRLHNGPGRWSMSSPILQRKKVRLRNTCTEFLGW